jgi:hypothetical protein
MFCEDGEIRSGSMEACICMDPEKGFFIFPEHSSLNNSRGKTWMIAPEVSSFGSILKNVGSPTLFGFAKSRGADRTSTGHNKKAGI